MFIHRNAPVGLFAISLAACAHGTAASAGSAANPSPTTSSAPATGDQAFIAKARADSAQRPYTLADIHFVTGMIGHHAQAILMAGWAPSHSASPSVRTLCERIINAQRDEITIMQNWLRDRHQPVPEPAGHAVAMDMPGMHHDMLMPGMLTDEQLRQLDAARGPEFDRLFLRDMIQHHQGAVQMVKELYATPGAAQDELVWKLSADINADQTTEIARMQRMLLDITLGKSGR